MAKFYVDWDNVEPNQMPSLVEAAARYATAICFIISLIVYLEVVPERSFLAQKRMQGFVTSVTDRSLILCD